MPRAMLETKNLVKRYDGFTAVDDLSFEIYEGDIFGLLGPNGAGKTTAIRTIMDIFKPDAGAITVLGHPPGVVREKIGYLPEERGLYQDQKVLDVLIYLAELKGVSRTTAREQSLLWLERVELSDWAQKKVRDLSRGMQQKLQFVASVVHDPELLILDEPFAGLDPLNVDLLKRLIRELQQDGKTVMLSAHQMNLVEALCERILLIDDGKAVLYGDLAEIKQRHSPGTVYVKTPDPIGDLPGVARVEQRDDTLTLTLKGITPQDLLRTLVERNITLESFEVTTAPLEDIFIAVVRERDHA
jgi:ABC-2 type transport system ATP-binding protein